MKNMIHLQKAFALAHRAGESDKHSLEARQVFQLIAHELWLACGRPDDAASAAEAAN